MLFSLELTLAGLGVYVFRGGGVIHTPSMRLIPPQCVYTHIPPWFLWSLGRRETRATPDTPPLNCSPQGFQQAPPPFWGTLRLGLCLRRVSPQYYFSHRQTRGRW